MKLLEMFQQNYGTHEMTIKKAFKTCIVLLRLSSVNLTEMRRMFKGFDTADD